MKAGGVYTHPEALDGLLQLDARDKHVVGAQLRDPLLRHLEQLVPQLRRELLVVRIVLVDVGPATRRQHRRSSPYANKAVGRRASAAQPALWNDRGKRRIDKGGEGGRGRGEGGGGRVRGSTVRTATRGSSY